MGLRFSRHVSIIPGLRVNLSKRGASLSIGHRGAWLTFGPRGNHVSVGLPGTGLYYTASTPRRRLVHVEPVTPATPIHAGHRLAFIALALILLAVILRMSS